MGGLLPLRSAPVKDANSRARIPPTTLNARPRIPPIGRPGSPTVPRSRRSSANDPSGDTAANTANTHSTHTPSDIGDQDLKVRPWAPGVTVLSMCPYLHQLAARAAGQRNGQ